MKVYTKIVYDKNDNIIEEHSYNYKGPVSQARKLPRFNTKSSKILEIIDDYNSGRFNNGSTEEMVNEKALHQVNEEKIKKNRANIENAWKEKPDLLNTNQLHKFASYNTLFTLSGLKQEELHRNDYLKSPVHDIIARSGGIGDPNVDFENFEKKYKAYKVLDQTAHMRGKRINHRYDQAPSVNILAAGHDIFFENVNILSTVGPNPERGLANFTRMEFELHEPFGITLVEKIRAATFINDYDDYQDAPLLLTIEWKGWDEQGLHKQEYSESLTRKIPILISRVQFEVDAGGAKYHCIAVPYGDLAFDDRFKFPRTILDFSANEMTGRLIKANPNKEGSGTPTGWVGKMVRALNQQMEDEKEEFVRELSDEYDFVVDPAVAEYGDTYLKELQSIHHLEHKSWVEKWLKADWTTHPEAKVQYASGSADMKTALPKFFEDAIRTLHGYQQLAERFWWTWGSIRLREAGAEDPTKYENVLDYFQNRNRQFEKDLAENQYVDWFMVKPMVYTNNKQFDNIRKVHPKKIVYYAQPTKIHILKFIKPGVSFGNIDWNKYVKKQYDYIYTGNNVDVQTLKIDYKSAYYMRNVRPYHLSTSAKGDYEKFKEKFDITLKAVFGQEKYPEPSLPYRQEPSHIRGRSTVNTASPSTHKSQEFYDYLTNPQADMMKIELEILGDPAFICQDIYTTLRNDNIVEFAGVFDSKWGSFNAEQYQPLIKVNYRLPDEIDEREGLMFEKQLSIRESLFFNGIYQVTKIDSRINQGQFTQVLTCVRLNNQKGKGLQALLPGDEKWMKKLFKKEIVDVESNNDGISDGSYS